MTSRSRAVSATIAILVPLALLTAVAVLRNGSDNEPAKLPISIGAAEGGTRAANPMAADMAGGFYRYEPGPGLPTLDGSGRAYRFVADVTADNVRALAKALGLEGEPQDDGNGGFTVTSGDASLSVYTDGGGAWYYGPAMLAIPHDEVPVDAGIEPSCIEPDCAVASGNTASSPVTTIPGTDPAPPPPNLPTRDEAETIARDLLAKVGVDVDAARITVHDGYSSWYVTADPVIEGLPTSGIGSSVSVGPEGRIENASGFIGRAEVADEYPLIGTSAAIDQLTNGGYGVPAIAVDAAESAPARDDDPAAPSTTVVEQVVTITAAERGLLTAPSTDGSELWLVPAYLLTADDGQALTVLAIDDSYIAQEPEPLPEPEPTGTDGGSVGGSPGTGSVPPEKPEPAPIPEGCATTSVAPGANSQPVCE